MDDYEKVMCLSDRKYTKRINGVKIEKKTCGHFLGMFKKGEVNSSFYCPTCGTIWNIQGNEEAGYEMKEYKRGHLFNTDTSPKVVTR
jgi:predicted RNA-binding Zn-ribbon protein involved in translation (DUF1610 family)